MIQFFSEFFSEKTYFIGGVFGVFLIITG